MKIGKAIAQIRKDKKLSQDQLAKKSGIRQTTLSQIENDKIWPGKGTLENIAEALSVSPYLIFLLSLEISDIPDGKKEVFEALFPSIRGFALGVFSKTPDTNS